MSELAKMYKTHFTSLEKQVGRLETVSADVEERYQLVVFDIVTDLRKELPALREQVELRAEWG